MSKKTIYLLLFVLISIFQLKLCLSETKYNFNQLEGALLKRPLKLLLYKNRDFNNSISAYVWTSINVVIMSGVSVWHNAIIESNSTLSVNIPSNSIVFRSPRKIVKCPHIKVKCIKK